jgi:phosphopantothenoylcysteine decarboxylase/phosphopantothenate--cysteine ligase
MKILLGVCGGVAAYKSAELLRILQRQGIDVQVAMTAGAEKFVTPLTFASLSGRQVLTSLWTPTVSETSANPNRFDIEHIRVAQEVDAVVIAPATANMIARLAHGLADDLLSTLCLATPKPILLAPAMNVVMWQNAATQENLATLRRRGFYIIEPASGELACGMVGEGRLAEPADIAEAACNMLHRTSDLAGEVVLITAGGTREPIDPVRFLGNRSSGKMGHALAEAAHLRGARVILITTSPLDVTHGIEVIRVTTAVEMQCAVHERLPQATVVVMAAAVADYRVKEPAPHKLKKQDTFTLELIRNEDILRSVIARCQQGTTVIGFAAETENLLPEAERKLREKQLDAIVANDVSQVGSGFESDRNAGFLLTADGTQTPLPLSSKRAMADTIWDRLSTIREAASLRTAPALSTGK